MEVAILKLYDLDQQRGTVMIRQGKGKKDRHIPIGELAVAWINKYVHEARPKLLTTVENGTVFLTDLGQPFHRKQLTSLVRHYLHKSKIGKMEAASHTSRSTPEATKRARMPALSNARSRSRRGGRAAMIEDSMAVHMTEAELARDLHTVLEKVRQGLEVVVEQDSRPVAVIRSPKRSGRPISECIASARASASKITLDGGFAADVEEGIRSREEPWNPPSWD